MRRVVVPEQQLPFLYSLTFEKPPVSKKPPPLMPTLAFAGARTKPASTTVNPPGTGVNGRTGIRGSAPLALCLKGTWLANGKSGPGRGRSCAASARVFIKAIVSATIAAALAGSQAGADGPLGSHKSTT